MTSPASMPSVSTLTRGLAVTYYGATAVDTGNASLNELISTSGMAGMLNTIWLILCAMCFGAAMVASRMIESITGVILRWVRSRVSLVSSTVGTGIFLNITTGDQFISIVLTANMFKNVYEHKGYEPRLLSRTAEDSGRRISSPPSADASSPSSRKTRKTARFSSDFSTVRSPRTRWRARRR